MPEYEFLKGHGTENDFVLLPDHDGAKDVEVDGDLITADLGTPTVLGESKVGVPGHSWAARHVDMGNPHAVAFVDSLDDAGELLETPEHDEATYPHGVNVEFVV